MAETSPEGPCAEVERAQAYLAAQRFQPRKVGEEWHSVYPASGRPGTLTDEGLIEKARKR